MTPEVILLICLFIIDMTLSAILYRFDEKVKSENKSLKQTIKSMQTDFERRPLMPVHKQEFEEYKCEISFDEDETGNIRFYTPQEKEAYYNKCLMHLVAHELSKRPDLFYIKMVCSAYPRKTVLTARIFISTPKQ